jgi:hypothetical protein
VLNRDIKPLFDTIEVTDIVEGFTLADFGPLPVRNMQEGKLIIFSTRDLGGNARVHTAGDENN